MHAKIGYVDYREVLLISRADIILRWYTLYIGIYWKYYIYIYIYDISAAYKKYLAVIYITNFIYIYIYIYT